MTDQISAPIPTGWRLAKIGELFESWGGHTPSKANLSYWGPGVPWISSKEVKAIRLKSSTYTVTQKAINETGLRVCPVGSVLVVVRSGILAHTLPVAVTEVPVTVNQDLKAFYSDEPLLNEWLALFLRMSAHALLASSRRDGTTVQSVQYPLLKNTLIPVPPIGDRRYIIEVIGKTLDKQSAAFHRLASARRAIERFREAVLAAACSGRLTADWREKNDHEATIKLLEDIRDARGSALGSKSKKASEPENYNFEVPGSWTVTSLDRLSARITSGSRDWSRFYGHGSGTFVMAQNVRRGYLDWSFLQSVDPPESDASRDRSRIAIGDLLVTIVGANTGDAGLVTENRPEHYVCQSVALARPALAELGPFLNLWFNSSEHGRGYFEECIYGAGRPHLSFDQLKAAPIALPPLAEQEEILRRVEALMKLADGLLDRLKLTSRMIGLSSQAVLIKAFRGELNDHDKAEAKV